MQCRAVLVAITLLTTVPAVHAGQKFVLTDYLHHSWRNECVTFQTDSAKVPKQASLVGPDGKSRPVQVRMLPGGKAEVAFVVDALPADGKVTYKLVSGKPVGQQLTKPAGDWVVLDAGPVAVRVPAPGERRYEKPVPLAQCPPPIGAVRGLSGVWLGKGRMAGDVGVKSLRVAIVAVGPVYAEVRCDYTLTTGRYTATVRVVRGQDVVLVQDEFDTTKDTRQRAYFQFSFKEGLAASRVAARGRFWGKLKDEKSYEGQRDYALSFDADRRELSVIGYVTWWPATTRVITLHGPKTADTISFFPRRVGQWRNPMGSYLEVRKRGDVFLSLPLYVDQDWVRDGVDRTSPYYTGRLEKGWPGTACRRLWAFWLSTKDKALTPVQAKPRNPNRYAGPAVRSALAQAIIRYSDLPLDKIKDWVFQWDWSGVKYPRLYLDPKTAGAVRKRAKTAPGWDRYLGRYDMRPITYILTRDRKIGDELLHATNNQVAFAATWGALPGLRHYANRVFGGWGYVGFMSPNNATPMNELVRFDAAMSVLGATQAEKTEMRHLAAFVAQMVYDPDWHAVGSGWHLGNPNMPPRQEHHLGVASAVLPRHPQAPKWRARGEAELTRLVDSMTRPSGAWRECPHYEWEAAMYPMFQSAVPIKLSGGADLFAKAKLRKTWDYLVGILTPPSPRFRWLGQKLRVLPAFGNGSWEFMPLTGWLAAMTTDTDPAFSKRMMWAWTQQGRPFYSLMSRLVIDPNLPAEEPDLRSANFKGFGCTLRSGFPSEYETWMAFRHGDCVEHYNYGDQGSFMLHAKGSPLVVHFGSQYTPYFQGAWHFNRACVGHRALTAADPVAKHFGPKFADYALGTEGWRDEQSGDAIMRNKAFVTFPSADYARAEMVQVCQGVIGKDHTIKLPPNTPIQQVDIPDTTWARRILLLKDADPRLPNYYLIRDDFLCDKPLPGEWNIWTLADKVDVTTSPAVVTGKYGVDLDVYMAEPADTRWSTRQETNKFLPYASRQYLVDKKWIEVLTNLRAQQAPGKGFLAVLYPRFRGEQRPVFTRLADGKGVKVVTPRGTDWAFLSAKPVRWQGDGLAFSGTAGAIRKTGAVYEVIFAEPGRAAIAGRTIVADRPMRIVRPTE